jgi:acyl-homoserine-lactone acylase
MLLLLMAPAPMYAQSEPLAQQVEIRRTAYGVPHILAENLRAGGYALGWVQLEDYGERVVRGLVQARGELGLHLGAAEIDGDFADRLAHRRAVETYHLLSQDIRDVLEGFALGVNRYIELHPEEFATWGRLTFTGHDIHARGVTMASTARARQVLQRLGANVNLPGEAEAGPDDGSNTWAFAPSRTKSGHAILMRNPHLAWSSGYYEAHLTVPGKMNFYGEFRIGSPIGIIGGFNEHLGWSTTNNAPDTDEIYALDVDPLRPDHYLFDGASVPLRRETVTVEFRNGRTIDRAARDFWFTPLGPVAHRDEKKVYIVRAAGDGEYRGAETMLRMMQAATLEEWKNAMRVLARSASNFTYADDRGNIFFVWNATLPRLPHAPGADTMAIPARRTSDIWTKLVPFDSLPQVLNPPGGYVHNENDEFHFTNLNRILLAKDFPPNMPAPRLGLRSQHALQLVHSGPKVTTKVSLEDVIRMKHSMRMLLADRVKDDLLVAVAASNPSAEVRAAADVLKRWDNTVAAESRGGVLFETWWRRHSRGSSITSSGIAPPSLYREPWTPDKPTAGPRGLSNHAAAAADFAWAVDETKRKYGSVDVPWGEVHRVRRGKVDVPVGGCTGQLGCFRVLQFGEAEDGKLVANGGDGWVLAVEFAKVPRAYTVLAYGESDKPESPNFDDQAAMFAENRMKPVAFTEADIARLVVRRYRPGVEPGGNPR